MMRAFWQAKHAPDFIIWHALSCHVGRSLAGFAFFSHQVGGFLGVWLGGIVFDRTGSYDMVWYLAILFGVLSGLINLPIVEKPVARMAMAAA